MTKNFVNHRQMSENTVAGILQAIGAGSFSKREVQAYTSFSWGNVSQNIAKLLEFGVIVPAENNGSGKRTVGRQAQHFTFTDTDYLLLGMEIKSDAILSSLVNLSGREISSHTLNGKITQENILDNIAECYEATVKKAGVGKKKVYGVSFSLSGAVNTDDMIWMSSGKVQTIHDFDFSLCRKIFPSQHIRIERSTTALTRTVLKRNSVDSDNFVFLVISNGIGMSVQQNGRFLAGSRGMACEIGHIPYVVDDDTEHKCRCGKENCLELFLSKQGILNEIKKLPGFENIESFTEAIDRLDPDQGEKIYQHVLSLLVHISVVSCNIFDPECLVIGGKALNPWVEKLKDELEACIKEKTTHSSPQKVIVYSHSDLYSTAYGTTQGLESKIYQAIIEKINS